MKFVILGRTSLWIDGQSIPLGAAKQRAMLGLLLYYVRVPVRIDTILAHLWTGQRASNVSRASLYALVSRIRHVLAEAGLDDVLTRSDAVGAYRLDVDPDLIDFHVFKRLLAGAREAATDRHHDAAVTLLTKATELWRDEPLADLRGGESDLLRDRMNGAFLEAHKLLAKSQLAVGQHQQVLTRLEPFVLEYDLDESLAQSWIAALCGVGREDEARAFLLAFRRRFAREMRTDPAVAIPQSPAGRRPPDPGRHSPESNTARSVPHQLPTDISDFAGHDDLLAAIDTLIDENGDRAAVIVVSGMPGVGKTTFSNHWAHRRSDLFPDGQLYLNINAFGAGPTIDVAVALGRLLTALDVPPERIPTGIDERRDRLNRELAGRRIVLLLDNVRDSHQARKLIPTAAGSVTLVTSRNRLRGLTIREGARCITVPPLPEPVGRALLRRVIGAARASAEPAALHALAQLAGGLPLALRIVGEHVAERPHIPVADLVSDLSRQLLSSPGDDDEASLRTVFNWSYDGLRPEVARHFRLLGVFPGSSISVEAAAALHGIPPSVAQEHLDALGRAHLVNQVAVRRWGFHDLVQRYAVDRVVEQESDDRRSAALRRLLDWYLLSATNATHVLAPDRPRVPDLPSPTAEAAPMQFDTDVAALKWYEAERENISAVTRCAIAAGFHRHGWQLPSTAHEIYDRYGRQDDVLLLNEMARSSARIDGHLIGQVGTLLNEGAAYFAAHDYERAAASLGAASEIARQADDSDTEAICLHNLASLHLRTGKPADAVRVYTKVLDICRQTNNATGESSTLQRLGDAFQELGRYEDALTHYRRALAIRKRVGALRGQGETHAEIAALHLHNGDPTAAFEHCQFAIAIAERARDDAVRCDALTTSADARYALSMNREALHDAEKAAAVAEGIGDPVRHGRALVVLVDILFALGRAGAAGQVRDRAGRMLQGLPDSVARPFRARLRLAGHRGSGESASA